MRLALHARFIILASATPQIGLPFNAQVPPAGRVSQPYDFTFAAATFTGATGYNLVNGPPWLQLQGRTFSGTPTSTGTDTFAIRADGDGGFVVVNCLLAITNEVVTLGRDVSAQLQQFGSLSGPTTLSIHPGDAFAIQFTPDTFQGVVEQFYAILSDRTPLPAWLGFNADSLSFYGIAPGDGTYSVRLIASVIAGFSSAEISFTLKVAQRILAFRSQTEPYYNGIDLSKQLFLDAALIPLDQIATARLDGGPGLTLDQETLVVSGTADDFEGLSATVTVQDIFGDFAEKTLTLGGVGTNGSTNNTTPAVPVPAQTVVHLGDTTAVAGQTFAYIVPNTFGASMVTFDPPQQWLSFTNDRIAGQVPLSAAPTEVIAVVNQKQGNELGEVRIKIVSAPTTTASPRPSSTSPGLIGQTPSGVPERAGTKLGAHAGLIIGLVLGITAAFVLLALLCMILWRRRHRKGSEDEIDKSKISKPFLTVEQEGQFDEVIERKADPPPQLDLPVPSSPMKTRLSTVSSLGAGEQAIRIDDNIPVWGRSSRHGIHDSYSAAAQLEKHKRASLKLLPSRHSKASIAPGIDMTSQEGSLVPTQTGATHSDLLSRAATITSKRSSLFGPLSRYAIEKRRSIRQIPPSRTYAEDFDSYMKSRSSGNPPIPITSSKRITSPTSSTKNRMTTYSKSSDLEPPSRNPARLADAAAYPRTIAVQTEDTASGADDDDDDDDDRSSMYTSTSSEITSLDLAREMAKPRHMRGWVIPGEASPTPPPVTPQGKLIDRARGQVVTSAAVGLEGTADSREQARRKMGQRLGRDSKGLMRGSSSPLARGEGGFEVIEPYAGGREQLGTWSEYEDGYERGSLRIAKVRNGKEREVSRSSGLAFL